MPGELTPGGEACNGEDEDCDGKIDEDLGEVSCGVGACRNTVPACTKGVLGTCQPLAPQTTTDLCNGVDDDCDGAVDEDCRTCVHVAPDGNDAAAFANDGATPFLNVQPAIDFAAAAGAPRVCVAAGAVCGASATFPGPAASELTMQDGVSVLAGYESTGWTRCGNSTTSLAPATGRGVYFPAAIARPTTLDGFTITSAAASTTAGVTVEGGRAVTLSNLSIQTASPATHAYGVNITNGADVTIVRSRIQAGTATQESIGVRTVGSRVLVEDNCTATDATTGRCSGPCAIGATSNATVVLGVALDNAPGSRLERSHVCAESVGQREVQAPPVTTQAVRIQGDGAAVALRANTITAVPFGGSYIDAVRLTDCGGAAPWLVDNTIQVTPGFAAMARGVSASGACHPVIDSSTITAGFHIGVTDLSEYSAVVHCGAAAGTPSRCVIGGNDIAGVGSGDQTTSTWIIAGIDCAAGGCAKISRNTVVGRKHDPLGPYCQVNCNAEATALRIQAGGPFVDRNRFSLGCVSSGVVVSMSAAWSRFQNNIAAGKECPNAVYVRFNSEQFLELSAPQQELDIHSNAFWGGRVARCPSIPRPGVGWTGSTKAGTFRNNWVSFGGCTGGVNFAEANASSDPALLENNALDGRGALYVNEGVTSISRIADVNSMSDILCSGNIIGGSNASAQWNLGTPSGAPLWDFFGDPRDDTPSIGAAERNYF
jgi:hypothetical protein